MTKKTEAAIPDTAMMATFFSAKNVRGISSLAIEPGKVTTILGANASGKSSLLDALKATLGRGTLRNLKRIGSDEDPETVLVLGDGQYRIEKSADKTVVKERVGDSAAYKHVARPQAFLDSLCDTQLSDPAAFLLARPADRLDMFLKALPIEVDWAQLQDDLGAWPEALGMDAVARLHPLVGLALVRDALFEERTGVNRSHKDKAASAYELLKAIPAEPPVAPEKAIAEAEGRLQKLDEAKGATTKASDDRKAVLRAELTTAVAKDKAATDAATAGLRGASERECSELRAACERQCSELERASASQCSELERDSETRSSALRKGTEAQWAHDTAANAAELEATNGKITETSAVIATLREQSERATKDKTSRELAARFETEAEGMKEHAGLLSAAIDNLDKARQALAKDLPIEGVEAQGKDLLIDGVPFDMTNKGARVELAVKVVALRSKGLPVPLVFLDEAEALDPETFALLKKRLEKERPQVFFARVTSGPLTVETS